MRNGHGINLVGRMTFSSEWSHSGKRSGWRVVRGSELLRRDAQSSARRRSYPARLALIWTVSLATAIAAGGGGFTSPAVASRGEGMPVIAASEPVVAAGYEHACALVGNGTVRCWGRNNSGQLGDGTTDDRLVPVPVPGVTGATSVSAGYAHTCALVDNGAVRCWGYNGYGQLGNGTTANSAAPVTVTGVSGATAVAAGSFHTCALIRDGTARCWGRNTEAQTGGFDLAPVQPKAVTVRELSGAIAITAGSWHSCALISGGTARCWGDNLYLQLGEGTDPPALRRASPVPVAGLTGATAIEASGSHTCALLGNGSVRCWGAGDGGQLGTGTASTASPTPVAVVGLTRATAIVAGLTHTCARIGNGSVRCWGYNDYGQLGNGTDPISATPVPVAGLAGVQALAAGGTFTCAVLGDGTVRCWGTNTFGQLGDGTTTSSFSPVQVTGLAATGVMTISAGRLHTCAVLRDGTARCWGVNSSGVLGDGTTSTRLTPVPVTGLTGAVAITAGDGHTCAVISDGTVRCWGANDHWQLGDGTTIDRLTPVPVAGITDAVAITAGTLHTCALISDGTARCWGYNGYGQLGDGTLIARPSAVPVAGLVNATAITAGRVHTCAASADGRARCWGYNGYGQLGDGTTTNRSTAVTVTGLATVSTIGAGGYHTCATMADGTGRCWGNNSSWQLGDVSRTNQSSPVIVTGLAGAMSISAGYAHVCALLGGGAGHCWGSNSDLQLGTGTTNSSAYRPTPMWGLTNGTAISAGYWHTCVVVSNGTARCTGDNNYGQLGDGTTIKKIVLVPVTGLP